MVTQVPFTENISNLTVSAVPVLTKMNTMLQFSVTYNKFKSAAFTQDSVSFFLLLYLL